MQKHQEVSRYLDAQPHVLNAALLLLSGGELSNRTGLLAASLLALSKFDSDVG
jgi:hypothetical protein